MDGWWCAVRMLVVDDEPQIAEVLDEYFSEAGFSVTCVQDGFEVLRAASRGFDIILLDVNMPGMDGFEVCRRLREHMSCPIIFLTARIEDVDQIDGFSAGADDYVLKPFSLEVRTDVAQMEDVELLLDISLVEEVLDNLLSNACGHARARVVLELGVKEGLIACVLDDGGGFSPEALQRGCEAFYGEAKSADHFGLGLNIASVLCGLHGGSLSLANAPQGGAAVRAVFCTA